MKNENNKGQQTNRKNARNRRRRGRKLPESVVLRRKSRMLGSDDLNNVANILNWGEHSGLHGTHLEVAKGLAIAARGALVLSQKNEHHEAARKIIACKYVLRRNERVAHFKVLCRDGRERTVSEIFEWYAGVHFRVADEIAAAEAKEAEALQKRIDAQAAAMAKAQAAAEEHVAAEEEAETAEANVA